MLTPKFEGVLTVFTRCWYFRGNSYATAIYLHSSLTQNRIVGRNDAEKKRIFKFEFIDIVIAMIIAGAINMCMLIVSAAVFFKKMVSCRGPRYSIS